MTVLTRERRPSIAAPEPGVDDRIVLVNRFYPKPGKLAPLLAAQISESRKLGHAARAKGWLGNRINLAVDHSSVVIVTAFESDAARDRWAQTDEFVAHLEVIEPLLDRVESLACVPVVANGEI